MHLSEHFTLEEMCKSDTALRHGINNLTADQSIIDSLTDLCSYILEPIRAQFETPFTPTSGYRCSALNKTIGSSNKSQHVKGEAADIEVPGVDNYSLALWIESNLPFDQLILEYYTLGEPSSGWIHVSHVLPKNGKNRKACVTFDGNTYQTGLIA
jgi:hypothetical protein